MLYQPMSSPQITRMLGLAASCAAADDTPPTVAANAIDMSASKGF